MPGRGNAGGNRGGHPGHGAGHQPDDAGGGPGHSDGSPGHQKREAGAQSARDFAPGHTDAHGQMPRNAGDAAVERPEPDSLERET